MPDCLGRLAAHVVAGGGAAARGHEQAYGHRKRAAEPSEDGGVGRLQIPAVADQVPDAAGNSLSQVRDLHREMQVLDKEVDITVNEANQAAETDHCKIGMVLTEYYDILNQIEQDTVTN